jgi:hypothetical protein
LRRWKNCKSWQKLAKFFTIVMFAIFCMHFILQFSFFHVPLVKSKKAKKKRRERFIIGSCTKFILKMCYMKSVHKNLNLLLRQKERNKKEPFRKIELLWNGLVQISSYNIISRIDFCIQNEYIFRFCFHGR